MVANTCIYWGEVHKNWQCGTAHKNSAADVTHIVELTVEQPSRHSRSWNLQCILNVLTVIITKSISVIKSKVHGSKVSLFYLYTSMSPSWLSQFRPVVILALHLVAVLSCCHFHFRCFSLLPFWPVTRHAASVILHRFLTCMHQQLFRAIKDRIRSVRVRVRVRIYRHK